MKKTLTIVIILVICVSLIYVIYNKTTSTAQGCKTDQECVEQGIVCDKVGEQPTCVTVNFASGEKYPEPKCLCLNPNMEY